MPLANGSRGMLTSSARVDTRAVVRATGAVAPASGGAGGTGVTLGDRVLAQHQWNGDDGDDQQSDDRPQFAFEQVTAK